MQRPTNNQPICWRYVIHNKNNVNNLVEILHKYGNAYGLKSIGIRVLVTTAFEDTCQDG